MEKIDLKVVYKNLYSGKVNVPVIVDVPGFQYVMIDGEGDPNTSPQFASAVETIYTTAYSIKAVCKKNLAKDFVVQPLEGLWYADDMNNFVWGKKDLWKWTLLITIPSFVSRENFSAGIKTASEKKKNLPFEKVRLEKYSEGKSVQVMHLGPYSAEGPVIAKMHEFAFNSGFSLHKKHHEIYLSDARKTPPEKLKTILRNPIK